LCDGWREVLYGLLQLLEQDGVFFFVDFFFVWVANSTSPAAGHVWANAVAWAYFAVVCADSVPACGAALALDAVLALFSVGAEVASSALSALVPRAFVFAENRHELCFFYVCLVFF
jgi:hypothetical protein